MCHIALCGSLYYFLWVFILSDMAVTTDRQQRARGSTKRRVRCLRSVDLWRCCRSLRYGEIRVYAKGELCRSCCISTERGLLDPFCLRCVEWSARCPKRGRKQDGKRALEARLCRGVINCTYAGVKMPCRGFFERVRGIDGLPCAARGA